MSERCNVRISGPAPRVAAVVPVVLVVAALGALAVTGRPASAADGRPLPSFTVVAPDGRAVQAPDLTGESRWVLVYIRPAGPAAQKLLVSLADWQLSAEMSRRLVLLVEGPVEKAAAYLGKEAGTVPGGFSWYADPDGRAAKAIGFTGAPALLGVRDGAIEWTLTGVLNDPSKYESVVRTWIGAAPAVR